MFCHAGNEEHQSLEAKTEAAVGHSAEAAGVEIPPHVFHRNVELLDALLEFVVVGFTFRSSYDFTDFREKYVHGPYGASVLVLLHVERLDLLGVVCKNHGALEVLFHEIALVFALQVRAPVYGNSNLRPEFFSISTPSV